MNHQVISHHHTYVKQKKKKAIDYLIYFAAIVQPLFTIPQIYTIWVLRQVEGVSIWTWGLYTLFNFIWLWYAIEHKEKPLIFTNILWILMQGLVFIGIVIM